MTRRGFPGAYNSLISNRPTCGGNKKAGLAPTIGVPINILASSIYSAKPPNCCQLNKCCYFRPGTFVRNVIGYSSTGTAVLCQNKKNGGIMNNSVQNFRSIYASG